MLHKLGRLRPGAETWGNPGGSRSEAQGSLDGEGARPPILQAMPFDLSTAKAITFALIC